MASPVNAATSGVNVIRLPTQPHWVRGTLTFPVAPTVAWAKLSRVDLWPSLFSDIVSLKTETHVGRHWELKVTSKVLGSHAHSYSLELSDMTVELELQLTGVDAHGAIALEGAAGEQCVARFDLYAATSGAMGWFISESALRDKQYALVHSYLTDLEKAF